MKNKKNESKLTLSKVSISNLEALDQAEEALLKGGSEGGGTTPTYVPINCTP